LFSGSGLSSDQCPPKATGDIVIAYQFTYRSVPDGKPLKQLIGLWHTRSDSVLRHFNKRLGSGFTQPRSVLQGVLDARRVTYFQVPDTPEGQIAIVYRSGPQRTGVLRLNWSHPRIAG
jgi:hypothetical protein